MICRSLFAAGALALGALLPTQPLLAQSTTTLRIATTPLDIGAEVLYAKDAGFFKKHGLDVDVSLMNNGATIASAVAGGSIDVAQANIVSLATAHDHGLPFVLIAPGGLYSSADPTTALVVLKSSPIKSAKDLEGKTVGVSGIKNITQIADENWMMQNGADPTKVNWIEMPFPQMGGALDANRVAASTIAEPELSDVVGKNGRVLAPVYDAVAKEFLIGAWFSTGEWAKAHPDVVKRFTAAMLETAAWANTHHAESAKILEKYTKITVAPGMKRVRWAEKLDAAQIQPLIDATAKAKVLKAPFKAGDLFAAAV